MTRVVALTSLDSSAPLREAVDRIQACYGRIISLEKHYVKDFEPPDIPLAPLARSIAQSGIVLVDVRSDSRLARNLPGLLADFTGTVVVLVGVSNDIFALTRMGSFSGARLFKPGQDRPFSIDAFIKTKKYSQLTGRLTALLPFGVLGDMRRWMAAQQYYSEGGPDNLENMLLLLLKHYGGQRQIKKVAPVAAMPPFGLYCPGSGMFTDLDRYRRAIHFDSARPTVAVLLHGGMHFSESRAAADALWAHLSGTVNVLNIVSSIEHNLDALRAWAGGIDLLVTMQYFRLWGGPYGGNPDVVYEFLQQADVPLLIGLRAFETELDTWRTGTQGLTPIETVLGAILPELDGAIEPFFIAGLETETGTSIGTVKRPAVVPERIERFSARVRNWLSLRRKENKEKKLALLTYSYPPGEDSLGSAGYLDVFASLKVFLRALQEHGYQVEVPDDVRDFFLSRGIVNSPVYQKRSGIRVPAAQYARWFETLPRAAREAVVERWGPPPGTLMVENGDMLLPGVVLGNVLLGVQPARGVHEDEEALYHDKALPPHHQYLAYYWYLSRVFEADAVVHFGMHGTLEFMPGKEVALSGQCFPDLLISDMPHLYYYWIGNTSESTIAKRRAYAQCISHASPPMKASGLYDQYLVLEDLLDQYAREQSAATRALIQEAARELHLPDDPARVGRELYRMKRRLIPFGLHIMDRRYADDAVCQYLEATLRFDRELPAAHRLAAESRGIAWDAIRDTPAAAQVETVVRDGLREILQGGQPPWCDAAYCEHVHQCARSVQSGTESDGLLRALDGRYVLPGRGGDPVRDPDVYPAGRAMYAFDPRLIPTVSAEVRGRAAAEKLLAAYHAAHGHYPESVAVVLWGFETMKTGGDTIAMILHLLGMRIRHRASLWLKDLEVIPLDELQRPRIDVVVTMCGIFRDTFATHIDLLNRAFRMVAELDEEPEHNFIRRHCREMPDACQEQSPLRLFGPAADQYATNVPALIETGAWDKEEELGDSFAGAMSFAYLGGTAQKNDQALAQLLGSVGLVAQERDTIEYEVTDLDHYYEFLGGLSRAVKKIRGQDAPVMVVDQTGDTPEVEDLSDVIVRATRTRTLNPEWIEGMLRHDFHGAKKIHDRVEYLLGFAATTGAVQPWVFDQVAERLVLDDAMREKLERNNPYAARRTAEVLLETERRGYWQATPQQLRKLREILLQAEGDLE